jgi:hypothetical protein
LLLARPSKNNSLVLVLLVKFGKVDVEEKKLLSKYSTSKISMKRLSRNSNEK